MKFQRFKKQKKQNYKRGFILVALLLIALYIFSKAEVLIKLLLGS